MKSTLLVSALEQIEEDHKLNPIVQPKLDVEAIELPEDGPIRFEMDVEVRPEFKLPNYMGLTVNRPVRKISDADVDRQYTQFLERFAQIVPKLEGGAELGDYIIADLRFHREDKTLNEAKELQFRLQPELRFQDGTMPNLGAALLGVKPGEVRDAEAEIGSGSTNPDLRGKTATATFTVHDLKQLRLPEVSHAFLHARGFESEGELRGALRQLLEQRLESQQRQALRREVMTNLMDQVPFDLPSDLIARQEKTTTRRLVAELKQQGLSETQIRAHEADIRANAHESTLRSLKEFFILAKIAEEAKIEVQDDDIEAEIESIAYRTDESPRRVRARIEKDGLAEAVFSQILEQKTIDRILEYVKLQEVPMEEPRDVETLEQSVSPASEEGSTAGGDSAEPGGSAE